MLTVPKANNNRNPGPSCKARLSAAPPILKSFVDDKKIRVVGGIYTVGGNHR